ncbi:hypothetical protein K439DRAFT_410738 [Ramaria rubella]|nr:hypothetical protein K439DRAFT_410738 [Ramaria rubella]
MSLSPCMCPPSRAPSYPSYSTSRVFFRLSYLFLRNPPHILTHVASTDPLYPPAGSASASGPQTHYTTSSHTAPASCALSCTRTHCPCSPHSAYPLPSHHHPHPPSHPLPLIRPLPPFPTPHRPHTAIPQDRLRTIPLHPLAPRINATLAARFAQTYKRLISERLRFARRRYRCMSGGGRSGRRMRCRGWMS